MLALMILLNSDLFLDKQLDCRLLRWILATVGENICISQPTALPMMWMAGSGSAASNFETSKSMNSGA
jgi:hypothetical protein